MPVFYIYTLQLVRGKYYVGTTTNLKARLKEHRAGEGSIWTSKYKPIGISKTYGVQRKEIDPIDCRMEEDRQVKKLMLREGIDNVRGGTYCEEVITEGVRRVLKRELFHAKGGCLRCGRMNHWARDCYARTDVFGEEVEMYVCRKRPRTGDIEDTDDTEGTEDTEGDTEQEGFTEEDVDEDDY